MRPFFTGMSYLLAALIQGCDPANVWIVGSADDDGSDPGYWLDDSGAQGPQAQLNIVGEGRHELYPDRVADVIVVGGGPAGLAAAHDAAAAGAEVLLLEREVGLGGVAIYTGGLQVYAGTPEQEAAGIEDSAEQLLAEWEEVTGGDPDDPWVRGYLEGAVPYVRDWLCEGGQELMLTDAATGTVGDLARIHIPTQGEGEHLAQVLVGYAQDAQFLLRHEVTGLVRRADGAVVGVAYKNAAGEQGWMRAESTVLATGGFLRDADMVRQNRPDLIEVELSFACGLGADGQGHQWALDAGATWDNPEAIGLYMHGVEDPREGEEGEELVFSPMDEGIWVNADGTRFAAEREQNDLSVAEAALDSGPSPYWMVMDSEAAAQLKLQDPLVENAERELPTREQFLASDAVAHAEDLEALAEAMDVDAEALLASVEAFNAYARGEAADAFRDDEELPSPIDAAPFYGLQLAISLSKAFTGIEVDASGQVVDGAGQPIPGLFAAGELTGMAGGSIVGDLGFSGSFSAVIYSGRVAGDAAAMAAIGAD